MRCDSKMADNVENVLLEMVNEAKKKNLQYQELPFGDFLSQFGCKRRSKNLLGEIERVLDDKNVAVYADYEDWGWQSLQHWEDLQRENAIRFVFRDSVEGVVLEIRDKICTNKTKCHKTKFKQFLSRVECNRKDQKWEDKIGDINSALKKYSVEVNFKNPSKKWNGFKLEDTVTFKLKNITLNKDNGQDVNFRPQSAELYSESLTDQSSESKNETKDKNAGMIEVCNNTYPYKSRPYQIESIKALNKKYNEKIETNGQFKGLLVIPTGGGKTLVAIQWLLSNFIDKNKKILWIAHRHELLDQVKKELQKNSYSNLLKNRQEFRFRIISGQHDRFCNINPDDDFVIASVNSIKRNKKYLFEKWLKKDSNEVFLVIDEAHHATARIYREVIKELEENTKKFEMKFGILGLTATPFRTITKENSGLKEIFPDDIVHKVDLQELIAKGFLSQPIFENLYTEIKMPKLSEKEQKELKNFNKLPKEVEKKITDNRMRNTYIVDHYLKNKSKYKQLLVFVDDQIHAITLDEMFKTRGIKSEYVISGVANPTGTSTISSEENKNNIQKFRVGEINVLINVQIVTEGTDIPTVQTVFLTRQTRSRILLTQMIGRALRGKGSGGTEKAYIVSFIDDWQNDIDWISPEHIYIEETTELPPIKQDTKRKVMKLISIKLIKDYVKLIDSINIDELEKLDFIERIPVGFYPLQILTLNPSNNEDLEEKTTEVLVFDNMRTAFEEFIEELDSVLPREMLNHEYINEENLDEISKNVEQEFFKNCNLALISPKEGIKDILRYYALYRAKPVFREFKDRDELDISKIAEHIFSSTMSRQEEPDYINSIWEDDKNDWKYFYDNNFSLFTLMIERELHKLKFPKMYNKLTAPTEKLDPLDYKTLSLVEMREKYPEKWKALVKAVYKKSKNMKGEYVCALTGYKSKSLKDFEIDHIKPLSKGGLSIPMNLQLVTRKANRQKGDKIVN